MSRPRDNVQGARTTGTGPVIAGEHHRLLRSGVTERAFGNVFFGRSGGARATGDGACKPKSAPFSSVLQLGTTWAGKFRRDCALSTAAQNLLLGTQIGDRLWERSLTPTPCRSRPTARSKSWREKGPRRQQPASFERSGALFEGVTKSAHSCAASVVFREPGAPLMTALARFLRSGK